VTVSISRKLAFGTVTIDHTTSLTVHEAGSPPGENLTSSKFGIS
jgi:hypothetical protein